MNEEENLVARLAALFHNNKDRIFIESADASLRFGAAWDDSARYANALAAQGVGPGDRVLFKTQKSVRAILCYLACLRCGAIFLPVNPAFTAEETAHILDDAAPRLVIADDDGMAGVHLMTPGQLAAAAASNACHFPQTSTDRDAPAVILYTSGTTGRPKGAALSHGNILANGLALVTAWRFDRDDVLLHALPLFHSHGLFVSLSCSLLSASRVRLLDRFDLDDVIAELPKTSVFMGVPTMYVRLAEDERMTPALCRSVRLFACGSAPLSDTTFARFAERTGHRIIERYGMTETAINTSNPISGETRIGTVGQKLDGVEIEIRDSVGCTLPMGSIGGVHVRGPHVFLGYWGRPEQTADVKTKDGWFDTGDIGVFDDDNYLKLVGRAKDLVITGGYNVYPAEVERVLERHPGVRDAAIIGVPHDDFGEAVTAIVAFTGTATPSEDEIRDMVRRHLAPYKVPKQIVFVDELPRNTLGKIDKTILRARYKDLYLKNQQPPSLRAQRSNPGP